MKELIIVFNNFDCFKHIRSGIGSFIEDVVPNNPTLVEIVLNEAVNNAIKHGNNQHIYIKLKIQTNGKLLIRVRDNGEGFSVNETVAKAIETNTSEEINTALNESGRGLFIMQQIMDKVIYNRKGNDVLLVKDLQSIY